MNCLTSYFPKIHHHVQKILFLRSIIRQRDAVAIRISEGCWGMLTARHMGLPVSDFRRRVAPDARRQTVQSRNF
jgi:hypothetical protein